MFLRQKNSNYIAFVIDIDIYAVFMKAIAMRFNIIIFIIYVLSFHIIKHTVGYNVLCFFAN